MNTLKVQESRRYIYEMQSRFSKLNDRYPGIFNMVIQYEDKFSTKTLIWVIDLVAKRESGEEGAEENEIKMGQMVVDKYVPENLKHPPQKESSD